LRAEDGGLWVDPKINDKVVRMAFDTGAEVSVLFPQTAESLGLRVTNWPAKRKVPRGKAACGTTEPCNLTLGKVTVNGTLAVVDLPAGISFRAGGLLAWSSLRTNIIRLYAANGKVELLEQLPKEVSSWMMIRLRAAASRILVLEIPGEVGRKMAVSVDTSNDRGLILSPQRWRAWKAAHRNRPKTLAAGFMPGAGLFVNEETWADRISFGPLALTDVAIMEANVTEIAAGSPDYQATMGLAALKQLDLIVDGGKGVAYLKPKETPLIPYRHNRIGSVFVPRDVQRDDELLARVLDASPAHQAGIQEGDVLLKIGSLDVTGWRTHPEVTPSRFWEQPAGTKVELTLRRGKTEYQTTVVLSDLIGPQARHRE